MHCNQVRLSNAGKVHECVGLIKQQLEEAKAEAAAAKQQLAEIQELAKINMHGLFLDLDDKKYKDFICPLSMEFARKLPPFKFEEDPAKRDVLEMRPLVVLPNGALYKGEWNKQTNVREGRGIEM